jgi:hypothetical protein
MTSKLRNLPYDPFMTDRPIRQAAIKTMTANDVGLITDPAAKATAWRAYCAQEGTTPEAVTTLLADVTCDVFVSRY